MTIPYEESAETGRIFYEAFGAVLGWNFRGAALPSWPQLLPREQEAFRKGAHEVMQQGWTQSQPPPLRRTGPGWDYSDDPAMTGRKQWPR